MMDFTISRPSPSHTEAIDYGRNHLKACGYTRWEIIDVQDNHDDRVVEIVFALWGDEGRLGEFTFEVWIDEAGDIYGEW